MRERVFLLENNDMLVEESVLKRNEAGEQDCNVKLSRVIC